MANTERSLPAGKLPSKVLRDLLARHTPSNDPRLLVGPGVGEDAAVIDFGSSGVGDPSSDLILAWNVLDAGSRAVFRRVLELDEATWQRGRGWALWKALIVLDAERWRNDKMAEWSRRTIREVFADHLGN